MTEVTKPNDTPVPDDRFAMPAPELPAAELRVLRAIVRRTSGFKKDRDARALTQMVVGSAPAMGGDGSSRRHERLCRSVG